MFDRARTQSRRRRRFVGWLAGAVVLAVLVPGVAMSTVPPIHNLGGSLDWIPKPAPPKDFVQYSECQIQPKGTDGVSAAAQYCDPPSSSGGGSPPTYWTAYYSYEFVWKAKTYRYEITVPFSSSTSRPASTRIYVEKIRVEISGPTNEPHLLDVQLYDGKGNYPIDKCCSLYRHSNPYSHKDFTASKYVNYKGAQASGTFWFGYSADAAMESPLLNFELPIVAEPVNRFPQSDGTCYTYDWQPYKCTAYITIAPA